MSAAPDSSVKVDGYVLQEEIGTGGMGRVYRAEQSATGKIVALKVLSEDFLSSPTAVKRFQREIKLARRLKHPRVARIHDGGASGASAWYAMDLVAGTNLQQHVEDHGPLDLDTSVGYILQAAEGLEYLHSAKITHRDIKPSNLILNQQGEVTLVDLGVARIEVEADADTAEITTMLTETGAVMGTVDYMAPEQAFDSKSVDHRADIYSLGCTLYFLVHGRPPFQRSTDIATMLAHLKDPIPKLVKDRGPRARAVNRVFKHMLAKQPEDRFESVQQLSRELAVAQQARKTESPVRLAAYVGMAVLPIALLSLIPFLSRKKIEIQSQNAAVSATERGKNSPSKVTGIEEAFANADLSQYELLLAFDDELTTLNLADGTPRPFVGRDLPAKQPHWSPDGMRVVFLDPNALDIFAVDADGSNLTRLTDNPFAEHTPKWSPDGSRIAFVETEKPSDAKTHLWVMNSDGTDPRRLTQRKGVRWNPVWSPDGEWILFTYGGQLHLIRPDGSGSRPMPYGRAGSNAAWDHNSWQIAFDSNTSDGTHQLFVMSRDGSAVQQITTEGDVNTWSTWSPDGRFLVYFHIPVAGDWWKGGPGVMRIYDTETKKTQDLVRGTFVPGNAKISWRPF